MTPDASSASTPGPGWSIRRAGVTAWRLVGIALATAGAWWLTRRLMPVLVPLVVATLLTSLLRPIAAWLERRRVPRGAAALASVALLLAVAAAAIMLVVPPFVRRIGALGSNLEEGLRQVTYSVVHGLAGLSRDQADRLVDQGLRELDRHRSAVLGDVLAGATVAVQAVAAAVLVVFLTFFLVRDGERIRDWLLGLVGPARRTRAEAVSRDCWSALGTYIRGVVFVATFDAAFIGAALLIVRVPLALPLIVLTWVAAFFPVVGAVTAGIAAALVALVARGLDAALVVTAAIVLVQQFEGHVLYPMVVGPRLKLHPIVVLLAVTLGATIGGIAGAFLAVPAATVASVVLADARAHRGPAPHVDLPSTAGPSPARVDPDRERAYGLVPYGR